MCTVRVVFLGMLFGSLNAIPSFFGVPYAKQNIRVLGRSLHIHPSCMHGASLQPIPLFVQQLFKQSFLIALGREEARR